MFRRKRTSLRHFCVLFVSFALADLLTLSDLHLSGGAAGNRTRVQRHSLEASPCAVRYASTRVSRSREPAEMTIPVAVGCPDESRDRTHRLIPLADARVRAEGGPGLTD